MKYFVQETNYTCGVACFRMMLSHFFDVIPSEQELIERLATNDKIGTHPKKIVEVAKEFELEVIMEENGTMERIEDLRQNGFVVMLAISIDVPHMTIYLGNNNNHVFFHDPYFGANISREIKQFISDKQPYPRYRWKVDAKEFKKYLPDYEFTEVKSNRLFIAIKNKKV